MRLDAARLCLDCEEVHEDQVCPLCGSEAFAYLRRWVQPSAERRREGFREPSVPPPNPRATEQLEAYRQLLEGKPPSRRGLVTKSAVGLAALGLAGWAWRAAGRARTSDGAEDPRPAGSSSGSEMKPRAPEPFRARRKPGAP